jgi:hypothetical protein
MLGGAMIARLDSKLLHESKITVSAAPAPAVHQSFSRLPWKPRASLQCHTPRSLTETFSGGYAFLPVIAEVKFISISAVSLWCEPRLDTRWEIFQIVF